MTDIKSRCVVEISTDTRSIVYLTIDRPSTDYRRTIDRLSTDYHRLSDRLSTDYHRLSDRVSTDCRPTVDRLSTDCRPLYRPISRSTLPTVNKIPSRQQTKWNIVHKLSPSYLQKPDYSVMSLEPAETRPRSNFSESRVTFPRYNQLS